MMLSYIYLANKPFLFQILTLLTLEELVLTMSNKLIQPRTLLFRPGTSYFLGGLARIDYLQGPHPLLYYSTYIYIYIYRYIYIYFILLDCHFFILKFV